MRTDFRLGGEGGRSGRKLGDTHDAGRAGPSRRRHDRADQQKDGLRFTRSNDGGSGPAGRFAHAGHRGATTKCHRDWARDDPHDSDADHQPRVRAQNHRTNDSTPVRVCVGQNILLDLRAMCTLLLPGEPPAASWEKITAVMSIHSIEAIAVDIPLTKNFGGSTYAVLKRCTVITRMRTEGGLVSEVYNGDNREHGPAIVRMIHEELAPRVRGVSILETESIWQRLFELSHTSRDRKTLMEAIACVDCAVWDLVGKASGKSVCSLLGGHRERLPIISIGGYYMEGKTLADIGREIEAYRSAGMAGCKFKVGGLAPEEDARRVEAARQAAGPDFVLAVDANRGWSAQDAIRFARLVEPLDIRWFEEPCHWYDDVAMMARVRHATRIPI